MCLKGGLKILNEDRQKKWYIIQKMQVERKKEEEKLQLTQEGG